MGGSGTDKVFAGSIPKFYETYLVPLLFEPYAADLVNRLASRSPGRVLELAAGTGVVTRALASVLPERVSIVATDLNQPMLDQASALGTKRPVEWRQADAMQLPFPDGTFDAVVCQFGVMFFPDKAKALSEAHRVLRPGGVLHLQRVGSARGERVRGHRDGGTRVPVSRGSTPLPRTYAPRLSRACAHRARSCPRRLHRATRDHHAGGAQPGKVPPGSGDRLLPGDTPTKRDRGARRVAARGSNRCRRGSHRPAVRSRRCGWQDAGARGHDRKVTSQENTDLTLYPIWWTLSPPWRKQRPT